MLMVKYFEIRILSMSQKNKEKSVQETEQCSGFFLKLLPRNLKLTKK